MDELIAYLLENEIFLSLNGDTLKLKYNGETISDDLLTKIRANKAELIEYLRRQQQTSNYQDILPVNSAGPFELSSAQRKLWVLSQFEEGIDAYIIHGQKVLHENIQFEAFKKAIDATIDRHEILRTVFNENEDGTVKQWIKNRSDLNFELNWKDFRTNSAKEKSVQTYITEDLKQPFDLENGPLLRATMLRLEDDKYLLFFAMHHIISDGWSLDILSKNVFAYYTAFSQNEEPNLKPLQIQYKDYAAWQLAQLDEAPYKEHRNYWLQSLGGELPLLDLPSTKKRPLLKTSNGHALSMSIDSKITHLLKTYTQENGGSLFMTLLAGWNVLMYKYTAQQDFIIGTPLAGRDHANLQDQIGFYIKTLALRNNINPTESFNTFYKRLKQNTLHSFSHQSYPFDELVEDLNLQRDMSRSAVFDVMLTLQSASEKGEKLDLNRTEENQVIDRGPCTSKFDIEIEAQEIGNSVSLDIFYNTDVYDKETIIGLSYHYRQVLKALFESPEKNIGQIDCLSDTEKENLLFKFNDTEVDYPAGQTVLDLFQAQVSKTPNQTAVISGEECLTYLELDEKSNQLADYLLKNYAINSDDLIGIKLTRNHWMLVVILGVIKSGGAYVPIDPNYPQDRIDFIEKDTNCKVCIDEIELNQFKENQVHYSSGQHTAKITENQLAYVIYTSGSTGNPKGVMIEHKNVFSFIKWSHDEFKTSAYDAVLFTTSLNFDLSIFEIFHPLTIGKELIVLENGLSTPEYSKSSKKLMLNTVPSVVGELLQQGMSFESISTLNMAGEPIPLAYKLALQNQVKEIRNLYGPSEDTTYSTFFRVDGDDRDLIGKPISNTRIYILNESDQLQLSGAIGEIAISGNGVTRGYLNRPELTKEKFVDNPFIANERLYKTGDLGRWLTDGNIALIGRKDDQVKIRGFRIELGEIEHALAQHKEIDRAVAMVTVNEKTTEKDLTIYFTLKNAQTETSETAIDATEVGRSEDLRNHLKELLPQYMLPSYYMELEELPLTTNGKIDKKALPNPQGAGLNNATVYVAPRNQLEEKLAEIWADILQQDQVGIKDDFLTLGGQSLKAVRLRNEYRRAFDVKLALKDLFTHTTIEAHAGLIESSNKTRFLKINSVNTAENYPISDAQRRIWVLSQFESESMAYNIPVSIQLSQDIEIESFKKAIAATIERHEILRTIFKTNIKSEIRQWVLNSNDLAFEIDYCDLRKEADPQNVAEQYIEKDGKLPFDLEKGPLLRASLLQLEEQAYVFYFNMHHIISDGWSMDVLAKDVLKFYQAYQNDLTPELKELVIQYKDYSAWQLEQLADESLESHRAFWLSNLSGELSLLDLPSAKQRPRIKTHNGRTLLSYLDKLSTTKINAFSEKQGGSLFMTLLASWNVMFHHYTGQSDVIIGTPVAGREHADLEDQIGLYINTLALRNKINPKESFSNFHKTLRENTLKSYDHQIYPYDRLIEELNLERDTSRNPVFDVMLMLQNNGEQQQEYALTNNTKDNGVFEEDLNQVLDLGPVLSKFDIAITFEEVKGHLALRFEYNEDVYEKEMVERLIGHYKQLVNTLLDDPTQEIGQVNYLAASEKHELLHEFNSGEITYPKNRTVIDLFEGRAAENPTKLALVFEGVGLNYQELNERANQLAHYLKATYKVAPSDIIAIQLPRNENLIITILAILKAGAAYLPIDIDAPEEKIAYVAQDSKCLLIIDADKLALFNTECKTYPTTNLEKDFGPNDLIYVIYTSGSTGLPKGVLIEHNHLVAHIHNVKELYGVSSESRFLQFFNVAFDAAAQEFFTTLSFGATLYLKTTEVDPAYIFDLLSTNKITHADFSTAFFNSLIAAFNPETFAHQLQFCAIGGEKLEKGILEKQWQQISKFTRAFYNVYGPTETTLIATYFPIIENGELANFGDTIPIGQPYPGRQVLILDENQQLQPIGVTGEICVGGISIARGYLNRKDLTAEKFLPNPYKSGERLYRTGDLGKYLANGNIEFSGRKDDQVKIRGYRIELGEVEHALSKHEEIQEVVVITIENEAKIKELVAYFSSSVQQNSNDIRTFLKETLAAYMVPAYFVQLDELPLTPNGKVDKKALPNPEDLGLTSGVEFVASTTAQEELLISVWSTVLKRKGIGIKDSFYNLGGDSIKSIQVVARLKEHGYVLKVENLLRTPVLDELAQLITRTERE
ncbi:MAG: amino acid adenylation domain-containing protein, partial [Crocinitomix sp.]